MPTLVSGVAGSSCWRYIPQQAKVGKCVCVCMHLCMCNVVCVAFYLLQFNGTFVIVMEGAHHSAQLHEQHEKEELAFSFPF